MYTMTTTLLIYFHTNVVGISAGAVGMIMLLSRVFDGFSDVLMGTIIAVSYTHLDVYKRQIQFRFHDPCHGKCGVSYRG